MAFVPQEHTSAFNYSVREFLLLGRAPYVPLFSLPSSKDASRAEETLAFVGLAGHGGRAYQQMSSGERRLVLICSIGEVARRSPLAYQVLLRRVGPVVPSRFHSRLLCNPRSSPQRFRRCMTSTGIWLSFV